MAGALALFVVWTMLSGDWSDSPARALVESNRALLYLLMLVFVGLHAAPAPAHSRLAALLRWVALAIAVTSGVALLTRLLPATFPTKVGLNNERLQFPLTYWNAMGMFTALGVILATHMTASEREPAAVRIAAAAALPVVAVTLYFSFSRGGIAAGDRRHRALRHLGASAGSCRRAGGRRRPAGGRAARRLRRRPARAAELLGRRRTGRGPLAAARGDRLHDRRWRAALAGAAPRPRGSSACRSAARARTIAFGAAGVAGLLALRVRHRRVRPPGSDRRPAARVRGGRRAARGRRSARRG